jgi:hypothetical protein
MNAPPESPPSGAPAVPAAPPHSKPADATSLDAREAAYRDVMRNSGRIKMILVLLVCALPIIASYFTYYVIQPQSRTNYGQLIEPIAPLPAATLKLLDGSPVALESLKGKWVMISIDSGACAEACRDKLYKMRQVRLTQGKEKDRLERVWLITDETPLETLLIREYDGTRMLRAANAPVLGRFTPAPQQSAHIYVVDPLGNLVLRFPADADPSKMKKDLGRLLKYSRIG